MAEVQVLVVSQVLSIPRSRIRPFAGQPRFFFDPSDPGLELEELAASMKERGQKKPISVRKICDEVGDSIQFDYEIVDGERRFWAAGIAGIENMLAWVENVSDVENQFVSSVMANFGQVGHSPLEVAQSIQKIRGFKEMEGLGPGEITTKLARIFARSEYWVYQHLALLRLHPEVQKMLGPDSQEGDKLSQGLGTYISSLHPDLQLTVAKEVAAKKLNLNQARIFVRQKAEEHGVEPGSGRGRKPDDDFKVLERFLASTNGSLDRLLTPIVLNQIRRRRPTDLAVMSQELANTAQVMTRLSKMILEKPEAVETRASVAKATGPTQRTVSREEAESRVADISKKPTVTNGTKPEEAKKDGHDLLTSTLVIRTLFYFNGQPQVNLSRHRLKNIIDSEHSPEEIMRFTLADAERYWNKPIDGTREEQTFIRMLHRFGREYGGGANLATSLEMARRRDESSDPLPLT